MATRPIYRANKKWPYVEKIDVEFQYFNGFSLQQKQRSIQSLHGAYNSLYSDSKILEISSKSQDVLGRELSAFNLQINMENGNAYSVEQLFQAGKVFEKGGPYKDLLTKSPRDAKRDSRLRDSGRLLRFEIGDQQFGLEPKTYFYNWLYVNALKMNADLAKAVLEYDAFSDIEFNPNKSINCQANAAALYVGLCLGGKIEDALRDKDSFLQIVYGQ